MKAWIILCHQFGWFFAAGIVLMALYGGKGNQHQWAAGIGLALGILAFLLMSCDTENSFHNPMYEQIYPNIFSETREEDTPMVGPSSASTAPDDKAP